MLVAYQEWRSRRASSGRQTPPAAPSVNRREKVRAKA